MFIRRSPELACIISCFCIFSLDLYSQETARFTDDGKFAVGTPTPDAAAIVDISSTSLGLLIPRMTTVQRDAISSPPEGLLIYNITGDKFDYYTGGAWKTVLSTISSSGSDAEGSGYCSEGVTDYDGNHYRTVKIGNQCWMAENLKSSHYSDGTTITGAYNYDNYLYNHHTFGKLYTWTAIMNGASSSNSNPSGVQGACPAGWHLPSDEEWQVLEQTLGMTHTQSYAQGIRGGHSEGLKLRETMDANLWEVSVTYPDSIGSNHSGFTALPGGYRDHVAGTYLEKYTSAYFWSCSEYEPGTAYYRALFNLHGGIWKSVLSNNAALSVRCIRD